MTCSRYRRIFLFTFCFIIFSASVTWSNDTADEFRAAFPGAGAADTDSLPAFSITVFGGIGGYLPLQIGSFDRAQWIGGAGAELLIRRRLILNARGYTGGIVYGTSGYTRTYGFTAGIAAFLFPKRDSWTDGWYARAGADVCWAFDFRYMPMAGVYLNPGYRLTLSERFYLFQELSFQLTFGPYAHLLFGTSGGAGIRL